MAENIFPDCDWLTNFGQNGLLGQEKDCIYFVMYDILRLCISKSKKFSTCKILIVKQFFHIITKESTFKLFIMKYIYNKSYSANAICCQNDETNSLHLELTLKT